MTAPSARCPSPVIARRSKERARRLHSLLSQSHAAVQRTCGVVQSAHFFRGAGNAIRDRCGGGGQILAARSRVDASLFLNPVARRTDADLLDFSSLRYGKQTVRCTGRTHSSAPPFRRISARRHLRRASTGTNSPGVPLKKNGPKAFAYSM